MLPTLLVLGLLLFAFLYLLRKGIKDAKGAIPYKELVQKGYISILLITISTKLLAPSNDIISIPVFDPVSIHMGSHDWLNAIIALESAGQTNANNPNEPEAKGILQEWPIMVKDVNRILGYQKYTLDDRLNNKKAIEIFWIYQNYYNPEMNPEKMCRIWCGGPDGYKQAGTLDYYNKVKTLLYT